VDRFVAKLQASDTVLVLAQDILLERRLHYANLLF
jgi:hypothetical protein